jgi:O-antigen ligase
MSPRLLLLSIMVILLTAVFWAVTQPALNYAGTLRPASFTGGEEAVHSAAYVMIALLLGTLTLWRARWLSLGHMLALATPLLVLVLLYQVRTTWVMAIVYFAVLLLVELRARLDRGLWLAPACFVTAATVLGYLASLGLDYDQLSSGRTDAYAQRIAIIFNRDLIQFMLGTGAGSEMLTNDIWWWEAKNSHNDFVDIAIQAGLVGLTLVIAMIAVIVARLDRIQLPLFVAFILSSTISNGLIARPFLAVLLLAFLLVPLRPNAPRESFVVGPVRYSSFREK